MLTPEIGERITIEAALGHNWIKGQPLDNEEEAKELIIRTKRHKRMHSRTIYSRGEKTKTGLWTKYFGDKKSGNS
jgi:hypothetical protein